MAFTPVDVPETDVDDRMLSRILIQFRERAESAPVFRAVRQAFGSEMQALSDAIRDVRQLRMPYEASLAQLDVLGRIVGQNRELVDFGDIVWFQTDTSFQGIDQAPTWVKGGPLGETLNADDAFFKQLIDAKIYRNNVKYGSIPENQEYMRRAFGTEISIEIIAPMSIKIYYEYATSDNVINFLERVKNTVTADSIYTLPLPATVSIGALERSDPLPPTVVLTGDTELDAGEPGDFDASASTAAQGATIVSYEWDWTYDGVTFVPSADTDPTEIHTYATGGAKTAAVRVTDDFGSFAIGTLDVQVATIINAWTQVAPQLNSQTWVLSLAILSGEIYGGTFTGGRLFKWNAVDAWTQVAPQLNSQTNINSMVVLGGEIYGATAPGGRLFKWNAVDAWVEVAPQLLSQASIVSLVVLNGEIYGGTNGGKLFKWNAVDAWVEVADQLGSQSSLRLIVLSGEIYGAAANGGKLLKWNAVDAWVEVADQLGSQNILSLAVLDGKIYAGTKTGGKLFEWNAVDAWVEVADQLNSQSQLISLLALDGELYGGTFEAGTGGRLFKWNGTDAWFQIAAQLNSQAGINALIALGTTIYGGTQGGGRLFKADIV